MFPFFSIGGLHVQSFNVLVSLGVLLGVLFVAKKFFQSKISPEHAFHLGTIAVVFGFIGCRLFYTIEFYQHYDWHIFNIFEFHWYSIALLLGTIVFAVCIYSLQNTLYTTTLIIITFIFRSFSIYIYPLFIIITLWLLIALCRKKQKFPKNIIKSLPLYILCLFIFFRIVHLYIHFEYYDWGVFHFYKGGMTIYGGLLCGFVFCTLYIKKHNLPFLKVCDILILSVFLAMVPGRLGCFANGCCFGKDAPDFIASTQFPVASPVGQSQLRGINTVYMWNTYTPDARTYIEFLSLLPNKLPVSLHKILFPPVYPTQLISSSYNLILFLLLLFLMPYKKYDGQIFLFGISLYSLCRFSVEILRNDNPVVGATGLTAAQNISFILFCISSGLLLFITVKVYTQWKYSIK